MSPSAAREYFRPGAVGAAGPERLHALQIALVGDHNGRWVGREPVRIARLLRIVARLELLGWQFPLLFAFRVDRPELSYAR